MAVKLKKLRDQVMVITGVSSGIGLTTARMAAARGARLVLAARSEDALRQLTDEITGGGGTAIYVVADVGEREDVRAIARAADAAFGGFDTWVNNAGISIYGTLEQVPVEEMRKLFETNFWGLVYGSLEAVAALKERGGGALINLGSTLSERAVPLRAVPLQGAYCASKHAGKAFTDTLRMEVEKEGAPISVTLIKPGPIDTPYPHHAKNYLDAEPTHVPPVYAPETVARAILHSAEMPTRAVFIGGGAKALQVSDYRTPRLADKAMEAIFFGGSKSGHPPHPRAENGLDHPSGHLQERGDYAGHVAERSPYTDATLHRNLVGAACIAGGLLALRIRKR